MRWLRRHFRKPWYCVHIDEDFNVAEALFWREKNAIKWVRERGEGAAYVYLWGKTIERIIT